MIKRKSPTKHIVKSHLRKNGKTHVKSYVRGSRSNLAHDLHLANPYINKPEGYSVELIYPDKTHEKQEVIATTYQHAIDEAFKLKTDPRLPEEIIVRDPSLKEVIHWAGAHAQKYGAIAAKKAYEYGKKTTIRGANAAIDIHREGGISNYAKNRIQSSANDIRTQHLIEQAYSPNRGTSILARTKLRNEYPEVYSTMDFVR